MSSSDLDRQAQAADYDRRAMDLVGELAELSPAEREDRIRSLTDEDAALAKRVRILLREVDPRESTTVVVFDSPDRAEPARSFAHPQQLGNYHILSLIAEGGMGEVYKAEQRTPVRRFVALKVIKLGWTRKA